MSLRRLHIDGYLQYANFQLELKPGVNVLHGPNEAGKSTLLRFVRYVLFGPPRRRVERGEPLAGGRYGGTLWFAPDVRVERFDKDVRLSSGGVPLPEVELATLLGQFDQAAFDAVFACDLDGLREMGALDDEALRRRLFASTVLGVGVDVEEVERRWDARRRALSKRSRKGIICGLEQELVAARRRLREGREQSRSLPARLRERSGVEEAIRTLEAQLRAARNERDHLEALRRSVEQLGEREMLRSWLSDHPAPEHPAAVWTHRLARLEEAERAHAQARGEAARCRQRLERRVAERDGVVVDEDTAGSAARVQALLDAGAQLPDRADIAARIQDARRVASERLGDLGVPGLEGVDLSRQTARALLQRAESVPAAVPLEPATRAMALAESELAQAEEALRALPVSGPALQHQHRVEAIVEAGRRAREARAELDGLQATAQKLTTQSAPLLSGWPSPPDLDEPGQNRLMAAVDRWQKGRMERTAARRETGRALAAIRRDVQQLESPVEIREVPPGLLQWAERRTSMLEVAARRDEQRAQATALTEALERQLASVPGLEGVDQLRDCVELPWARVALLTRRILDASLDDSAVADLEDEDSDRASLVEQQHLVHRLHHARATNRQWRFAVRVLLAVLALLGGLALIAWVGADEPAFGMAAAGVGALGLVALVAELYLGSTVSHFTRELSDVDADDWEAWSGRVHARLARIEVRERQLHQLGSSEARSAELTRDRSDLAEIVGVVECLVDVEPSVLAELAARIPSCIASLQEIDQLAASIQGSSRALEAWVDQGGACAELLGQAPSGLADALQAALHVQQAAELARRQTAREEGRRQQLRERRQQASELQQRLAELERPTDEDAAIRAAVRDAGGEGIDEGQWGAWLSAGQQVRSLESQLADVQSRIELATARFTEDQRLVDSVLDTVGVGTLDAFGEAVARAVERERVRSEGQQRRDDALEEVERRRTEVRVASEADSRRKQALAALSQALEAAGWPLEEPERVAMLAERLHHARDAERQLASLRETGTACDARWSAWFADVEALAGSLAKPPPRVESSMSWLRQLQRQVGVAEAARAERARLDQQVRESEREFEEAQARAEGTAAERDAALAATGVEHGEEGLLQREAAAAWEARHEALEETERLLRARLGDVDLDNIELVDAAELAERADRLSEEIEKRQEDKDGLVERRGVLTREPHHLEASTDVAEAAAEVEALEQRLQDARMELAEIELASRWLGEEYERFVLENQPAVLKLASSYLEAASDGTMVAVMQEQDRVYVQGRDGKPREPHELSRGSREMLYLVIRLALARKHAERTLAPILLDDVMVNQDPDRAAQIAQVLRAVGQEHQVILMTCRPEMRDLVCAVDPTAHVVELARFGGRDSPVGTTQASNTAPLTPASSTTGR